MITSILNIFSRNFKNNSLFVILACLLLSTASCRPDKFIVEEMPQINNGSFRVETDYPYYYIVYRYGKMKAPATINIRMQKTWEHNFTTEAGDTLLLEVHTLTSNIPGTKIKADIILNGKVIKAQETLNNCIDGDCFQAQPIDLSMYAIIK